VLLALGQSLNVTPIETRQDGVRVPTRQRQYVIDCRTNMTCGVDGGVLYLSAASGGSGGSANYSTGTLAFDGGYDAVAEVVAAWASPASSVICAPVGEEASVEGMRITTISTTTGSFMVRGAPAQGRHSGALIFVCTGN
jgi:hypothetical protein